MIFADNLPAELANAIRYVIMYKYGGIYSDTDIISHSHSPRDFNVLSLQNPQMINNNFLRSAKRHRKFYLQAIYSFTPVTIGKPC